MIPQTLLISTRQAGLWSMFFQVIGLIRLAQPRNLQPVVYFNYKTCWWSDAGYNHSRNAWEYFFEPVGKVHADDFPKIRDGSLERASLIDLWNELPECVVTSQYLLPHVGNYDHTEEQRLEYSGIVEKHIMVKREVITKINPNLTEAAASGCTAIHYRGTDKVKESPRQSIEDYRRAIDSRVNTDHKLFIATDSQAFLNAMIQFYGDRVIYSDAARSHDNTALHFGPHAGPKQAEECLLDVLYMSKCQHLIHGNSNVSNAVLAFNPSMTHDALHLL